MSKCITILMYHNDTETNFGNGYYPFIDKRNDSLPTTETFYLNDKGEWSQKYMENDGEWHKELVSIKGLTGNDGTKLLQRLNEETAMQQVEDGVSDLAQGTAIVSIMGQKLV